MEIPDSFKFKVSRDNMEFTAELMEGDGTYRVSWEDSNGIHSCYYDSDNTQHFIDTNQWIIL